MQACLLISQVRDFYNATVYPKWHEAEVFGIRSAPSIAERLRRQFRHFRWPHGEDAHQQSMLIAGCGSGHQVAQALLSYDHVSITAIDLSPLSLAFAHHKLHTRWPEETARRVRFCVADVLALTTARLPPVELVCCIGMLHHVPRVDVPRALENLAGALLEGGVLQLGTYSTLGIGAWWPGMRRLLHRLAPTIVDVAGTLLRQPAPHELRELRAALLAIGAQYGAHRDTHSSSGLGPHSSGLGPHSSGLGPHSLVLDEAERQACEHVLNAPEFYTATGCRDLLLHPCECSFTLLELQSLLESAGLELVGMWFQSLEADRMARAAYAQSAQYGAIGGSLTPADAPDLQADLARWHRLEEEDPSLFGRMHVLYAQKRSRGAAANRALRQSGP